MKKMTNKANELSAKLSARYGLTALNCEDWGEIELFGGLGMDATTFNAVANAAITRGDTGVTIYELESIKIEFPPVSIDLNFYSFNHLKGNIISHFEVAALPPSKTWAALFTNELKTFVYGPIAFLSDIEIRRRR